LPDISVRLEKESTDPLSNFDGYLATVEGDGRFRFEDVAPGDYRLTASSSSHMRGEFGSPMPRLPGAILELKADENRTGLTLDLFPDPVNTPDTLTQGAPSVPPIPVSVQGTLTLADGLTWKKACPTGEMYKHQLSLGHDEILYAQNTVLDKEGHFAFDKLEPRTYTLNLGDLLHGAAYVKSLSVDGREIPGTQFTLAAGQSAHLKVEISNDPASAAGRPRAGNTEPHYLPAGTHPPASVIGRVAGPDAAGAEVKLSAVRFNSAGSSLYQTVAAADGSFHFDNVQPGIYKLSTEGEHHQHSEYGAKGPGLEGSPLVLDAGQGVVGLDLKTYAKTSLCGKVIDPEGRPASGVEVWIRGYTGISNANGSPGNWTKHTVTGTDGGYAIDEAGPGDRELWVQQGERETFFPSGTDGNHYNGEVSLPPQGGACKYDIYLRSADGGSFKAHQVRGTVEGKLDPSLGNRFYIALEPADEVFTPSVGRLQITDEGSFTLKGVWPGKYTLTLYGEYGNGNLPCGPSSICFGYYHHLVASRQVTVADRDVERLMVSVGVLPTLDGEALVDGHPAEQNRRFMPAVTGPLTPGGSQNTPQLDQDGRFSFGSVNAGEYGVNLPQYFSFTRGDHYYVKSVLLNGQPIDGRHFQLKLGESGHLTINYASDGATGALRVGNENPPVDSYRDDCAGLTASGITLFMIPDPLPADNSGIIDVRPYDTGDTRRRDVSEVPPGKYHVLAVENFSLPWRRVNDMLIGSQLAILSSHAELVRLGALGEAVEVRPSQSFDFTLPVVTAQMRRLMAEMGMIATF
jgi:hypothetical protein